MYFCLWKENQVVKEWDVKHWMSCKGTSGEANQRILTKRKQAWWKCWEDYLRTWGQICIKEKAISRTYWEERALIKELSIISNWWLASSIKGWTWWCKQKIISCSWREKFSHRRDKRQYQVTLKHEQPNSVECWKARKFEARNWVLEVWAWI